jgi:copper transporter 1
MLFTWDTANLCIVFRWWHIQTTGGLLASLLVIVGLGAGYEYIRYWSRKVDSRYEPIGEETPLARSYDSINRCVDVMKAERLKLVRSGLYGFQVAYSFFLMYV